MMLQPLAIERTASEEAGKRASGHCRDRGWISPVSVQSLYTAAQEKLKLIYIVPCNDEYAILKEFAVLEKTPNVPALDLPGLDIVATAQAFGCDGVAANTTEEIKAAFRTALTADGPTVIAIRIAHQLRPLVPDVH